MQQINYTLMKEKFEFIPTDSVATMDRPGWSLWYSSCWDSQTRRWRRWIHSHSEERRSQINATVNVTLSTKEVTHRKEEQCFWGEETERRKRRRVGTTKDSLPCFAPELAALSSECGIRENGFKREDYNAATGMCTGKTGKSQIRINARFIPASKCWTTARRDIWKTQALLFNRHG